MKIVIDGNIGSGKTTQLTCLSEYNYNIIKEPIDEWPLDLFYSDPERWGFLFQMIVLRTLRTIEGSAIYERCPVSSKEVFWQLMKKHPIEEQVYEEEYKLRAWYPDMYILIDTGADQCYENIKKRSQAGDYGISLDYLKQLEDKYITMYENLQCPKFKVDGTRPIEEVTKDIINIIENGIRVLSLDNKGRKQMQRDGSDGQLLHQTSQTDMQYLSGEGPEHKLTEDEKIAVRALLSL